MIAAIRRALAAGLRRLAEAVYSTARNGASGEE